MSIIILIIKNLPTIIQIVKLVVEIIHGLHPSAQVGASGDLKDIVADTKVDPAAKEELKSHLAELFDRLRARRSDAKASTDAPAVLEP